MPNLARLAVKYTLLALFRRRLEAESVEGDESGGIVLIVGFLLAALHGGNRLGVHAERRPATGLHDVALVELHADFARDGFLSLGDESLNGDTLWREPESIINQLCVFWD